MSTDPKAYAYFEQLIFGTFHGTFVFTDPPVYHWYLSVTAIFLNVSYSLHNVIAWIKSKPLLPRWASICYIATLALVQPYWVLELVANVSLDWPNMQQEVYQRMRATDTL